MKFRLTGRFKNVRTVDDLKDIKDIKEELIRTGRDLDELVDVLGAVLGSIDEDNIKPEVLDAAGRRPVGSVELRYVPEDNAGYGYGTWRLIEDTITTAKAFVYIYMRIE